MKTLCIKRIATNTMIKKTVFRGSVSGRFVKEGYAKTHPRSTEKERVKK